MLGINEGNGDQDGEEDDRENGGGHGEELPADKVERSGEDFYDEIAHGDGSLAAAALPHLDQPRDDGDVLPSRKLGLAVRAKGALGLIDREAARNAVDGNI